MTRHLDDHQISAAVAGLDLEQEARQHLSSCLACRSAVQQTRQIIGERRQTMSREAPDWQAQRQRIIDGLPCSTAQVAKPRGGWRRPVLAAAATVLLAIALGSLWFSPGEIADPAHEELQLDQVLADVDAVLADDSIPGLWPVDPITDTDDLEALFANGTS